MTPTLFKQHRNRLGPHQFSARRVHTPVRDIRINGTQGHLDHHAALVLFCDDPLSAIFIVKGDRPPRPFWRQVFPACILQHIAVIVGAKAAHKNPRLIAIFAARHGRIDRNHNPLKLRNLTALHPQFLDQAAAPKSALQNHYDAKAE
jgi:hypothetical protein